MYTGKKINLLLFSSLTTSFLHFSFWFIFMFSSINFPGQCQVPWLCDLYIPADICREMRGDEVQTNPSYWHFYLSIFFPHLPLLYSLCVCVCVCMWKRDEERGWDTGRATEGLSACNCSSSLSFLVPCYPSLLWSSHIASNPLLMFCFAAKKKKKKD